MIYNSSEFQFNFVKYVKNDHVILKYIFLCANMIYHKFFAYVLFCDSTHTTKHYMYYKNIFNTF